MKTKELIKKLMSVRAINNQIHRIKQAEKHHGDSTSLIDELYGMLYATFEIMQLSSGETFYTIVCMLMAE